MRLTVLRDTCCLSWWGFVKAENGMRLARPPKSALVQSCLIPQRKFNAIAHAHLVIDDAEIVSNDMLTYSQLGRYFSIL